MKKKTKSKKKTTAAVIISLLIRAAVVFISISMIGWYRASGFQGLGRTVGVIVFGTTALCALLFGLLKKLVAKMKKNRAARVILYSAYALSGLIVLYVAVALGAMMYGSSRTPENGSTVVVLGCQVLGDRPSTALRGRLDTAYAYLKENPGARAVLSGGKGSNENISEAQCMFNYLTEKGISAERLFMEDKSTSTDENIRFSKKIIDENGLDQNIAIITDWYHEFRASVICDRNGINSGSIPSSIPTYITASLVTREMIAIPYELLFRQ